MERWLADAEATAAAGHALGRLVAGGDVIALVGDLGAGKTSFARGLAAGAGVPAEDVQSPTFALVHEYAGRVAVVHADLYRIERERELDELGWDDVVARRDAAVVVEWADRFPGRLPADHLAITLVHADDGGAGGGSADVGAGDDGDGRGLTAVAHGPRAAALLAAWARTA